MATIGKAKMLVKSVNQPDEVRAFAQHGHADVMNLEGGGSVLHGVFEPGWRWSKDVKPIVNTSSCQASHLGYVTHGHMTVKMDDGTETQIGPDDVFRIPPGHDAWVIGDVPWVSVDFEAMRTYGKLENQRDERILASIVITDIVDSTPRASALGSARWRDLIGEHNRKAAAAVDRHRGHLVKTTGDGVLAQFDGAERAIRGAAALRDAAADLGLEIRVGVHSGEVQLIAGDVRGIAVHTAARIMAEAGSGEILTSATVMDLIDGSGIEFEDAGLRELKGLHGVRQLYRLVSLGGD